MGVPRPSNVVVEIVVVRQPFDVRAGKLFVCKGTVGAGNDDVEREVGIIEAGSGGHPTGRVRRRGSPRLR